MPDRCLIADLCNKYATIELEFDFTIFGHDWIPSCGGPHLISEDYEMTRRWRRI